MIGFRSAFVGALAAGSLAACATPSYVTPVEVTRFTGATPAELGQGTITIEPATGLDPLPTEFTAFRDALAGELTSLGYDVVTGTSRQVAVIDMSQFASLPQPRRGPVSVGGGAGVGSHGSGVGLGVGIDLTPPPPEEVRTSVAVYIRPADGGPNLWEGRANFAATANNRFSEAPAAAGRVMSALFAGFPGVSGETIEVE